MSKMKEKTLKTELCNELLEKGVVQENDIVKHSYTGQIMSGKKKCVEKSNEMIALTTRGDCVGVCVKAPKESVFTEMEKAMITKDGNIKRYLDSNQVDEFRENQMATLNYPNGYGHGTRVHNDSVALTTGQQPVIKQKVEREKKSVLRIRKLVPLETMKLMGFTKEDYQAMRDIGMSDSAIYHCAGDSIIVPCLVSLLNPFVNDEHEHIKIVNEYVEKEIVNGD